MKRENLPQDVLDWVNTKLDVGEDLIWAGRPPPFTAWFIGSAEVMVSIGLTVMIGLILANLFLEKYLDPLRFQWLLILIDIVGLIGFIALMLRTLWRNEKLTYAISDRRALIITWNKVQSFSPDDIQFIERRMRRNGRGDIIFARDVHPAGGKAIYTIGPDGLQRRMEVIPIGFFDVENPRTVEALMLEVFRPLEVHGGEKPKRGDADEAAAD